MTFLPDLSDEKALASFSERLNRKLSAEADKLMGTDHGIPLGISMGAAFALILGKEAFSWNYRFIIRFMDRYNGVATRLLISLSTSDSGFPETKDVDAFASI